jgi:hypothetical protein
VSIDTYAGTAFGVDAGLAGPLIKFFKSQGCIVLHKCTTIRHAKVRFL